MIEGRTLIWAGLTIVCLGALLIAAEKMKLPLGRLPGDILWKRGSTTVYAPLVTCLLLSLAASLLLWLFNKR